MVWRIREGNEDNGLVLLSIGKIEYEVLDRVP